MDLKGRTEFSIAPEQLAQALRDPEMLRLMIPGCTRVTPTSADGYEARIEKSVGPITIRMTADVTVEAVDDHRFLLRAHGRNALAGTVSADLTLVLTRAGGGTTLTHDGHLTATGMAGKLLPGREAMLNERTQGMLLILRDALAANPPKPA